MTLSRNILIFLLQSPGLLINIKKSVFQPCQKIEFLEIIVDSKEINLSLPKKKVTGVMEAISNLFSRDQVSIREISKLIGKLLFCSCSPSSRTLLQFFSKTADFITKFLFYQSSEARVCLSSEVNTELLW